MTTRLSQLFLRTLRDDPSDAEVASHRLLVRAGYIRRQAPGVFAWLPLGLKVRRRVEQVIRDASANPRVQQAARRSGSKVLDDPELRSVLWSIVRRTAVDNPKFRQALKQTWTGPEAQQVLAQSSRKFEPTVRRIGGLLIGTPETGITPEFAAVLRNQVLGKDRRWLVLESPADSDPTLSPTGAPGLAVVRGHRVGQRPFLARIDGSSRSLPSAPHGESLR